MDLTNKKVLVTGSTKGIGLEIAKAFARQGADIVLNARGDISEEIISEVQSLGVSCVGTQGDVSLYYDAEKIVEQAIDTYGQIDILINNAGITKDKLLLKMSTEDFNDVLQVNLVGTFNMTQLVLKKMYRARKGTIINLSSVSGLIGNLGQANYAASKAGVVGLTKTTAREGALRGITCNAIAPGFIETDMTDVLSDSIKEQMIAQIPLKRFGKVEDIATTALFLATNPYITGQVINVDGGLVMND